MKRCGIDFFNRPTLTVAQELLGKKIFFFNKTGIITETEAYIGESDPACHAARGKTARNAVMYGRAGFSYVYFIYGMYFCLNFVTEAADFPAAVLIRGIKADDCPYKKTNGPGKLCRYFGITKENNETDLTESPNFYVEDTGICLPCVSSARIGISAGTQLPWRFTASVL